MNTVRHPSRIRHNGDTGADVQQGPVARIIFRLRLCVNLFYFLLLIHIPWFLAITKEEAGVSAWATPEFCAYLDTRGFLTKGSVSARLNKDQIP